MLDAAERHPAVVVGAVVVLSTVVRVAVAQGFAVPWISPDEMIYSLVGETLWETGQLTVRGAPIEFYSLLTPALVGLPLATVADVDTAIVIAQVLQAFAMSLVAVPVYLWGRRLVATRWALAAAILVVLPPALWYGGLLMTEALYYTLVTVALLAVARMLENPTTMHQGVALLAISAATAVRLQALVLLPVLILAVALHAWFGRSTATVRRLTPILGLIGAATIAALVVYRSNREDLLGAYGTVAEAAPSSIGVLSQFAWHAGGVVAITLVLPILAVGTLTVLAGLRGEADPALRAFLAVTAAYVALLVAQVATFGVAFLDHLSERHLVTAIPVLLLGLCVWTGRGRPRPWRVVVPVAAVAVAALVSIPASRLGVVQDSLTLGPLDGLTKRGETEVRGTLGALGVGIACALLILPRRFVPLVMLAVAAGFVALSVEAAREIHHFSHRLHDEDLGRQDPSWIDRAGVAPVLHVHTGEYFFTAPGRTMVLNRAIRQLVRLRDAPGGGLPQPPVSIRRDGALVGEDGSEVTYPYVVLPTTFTVVGRRLAQSPRTTANPGSALWRVDEPLRLASRASGLAPTGDFIRASVIVYRCSPGRLRLALAAKTAHGIVVRVNGLPLRTVQLRRGRLWKGAIRPRFFNPRLPCLFEIAGDGVVSLKRVDWVPDRRRRAEP